jgi:DeoR/GlpR family transcriptional regulator of sugar metabolism
MRESRLRQIVDILKEEHQVTVAGLAGRFGVAEMTIRRDLRELSARGALERTHGGAIVPERRRALGEPPMLNRMSDQADAKRRIGEAVADMILPGATVFIGSGTTALAVAQVLVGRDRLTVVSNALTVINALASAPEITVVGVGGFLRRSELSLIGHFAEAALRDMRVDKVIMGIRGIHPEHGLTSDHMQELMTDRAILGISEDVIVVADHTKFGHIAASRNAPVTAAGLIVTDAQAPAEMVAALRAMGVRVLLV